VRCFAVRCRGGGGGGCKASLDVVDVDSVDKERKGVKADAIRRRGACVTVDNMLKGEFKDDKRRLMMPSQPAPGFGDCRLPHYISMLGTLNYVFH
jgi:hypothetical protein